MEKPKTLDDRIKEQFKVSRPSFKVEYCDGCEQQTKHLFQSYEYKGKRIEHYTCDNCGKTGDGD